MGRSQPEDKEGLPFSVEVEKLSLAVFVFDSMTYKLITGNY